MTIQIKGGSTSRHIEARAFSATTGLPYTTAAYNDAGIALSYRRGAAGAVTAITPATQTTTGAYSSGGFVATTGNGVRIDLPDAALAAGVDTVDVFGSATAWVLICPTVQIVGHDPRTELTATRLGYLDNLSAGAVALASALTTAQADLTTLVGRITGAVALATSTTAAAIRSALGMASANLDTNIPGVLQTKAEADTAHGLLATAAALTTVAGYIDTEVAAIKAKTDNLPSDPADQSLVEAAITATQGALTTAIGGLNDLSSAQVQTAATAALNAYDPPTHAEVVALLAAADDAVLAAVAALNDLSSAEVAALLAAADDATLAAIAGLNNLSSVQAQAAAAAALAAYPVPLIADIEAAIEAGSGATPETFWNFVGPGGRTLSQSMIAVLSSMVAGSGITITRGDTISVSITGLGNLEDRTGLWLTVKANPSKETDLQARIQITEDDGLLRLNGREADSPADGSITVDDETNGDITIALAAEASAALARTTSWHWDVQVAQPGPGVWTPRTGTFTVTADVTRAT